MYEEKKIMKFWKREARTIAAARKTVDQPLKEAYYYQLKYCCIDGGQALYREKKLLVVSMCTCCSKVCHCNANMTSGPCLQLYICHSGTGTIQALTTSEKTLQGTPLYHLSK